MSATLACLVGQTVCRLVESGRIRARQLPPRQTPYGKSQVVFLAEDGPAPFYLLPRHGPGPAARSPSQVNYRADLYALKDLGADTVVAWTAAGAISHNLAIGQVVVPDDLIDMTHARPTTFFENSSLGLLRQFPVFCPRLRGAMADTLAEMKVPFEPKGTVAVTEGPRLETPAEIRMFANAGAELITHTLAPDFALAKELQMCFAGVCYLVNYAETGSKHRPFSLGDLFGGLTETNRTERGRRIADLLPEIIANLQQHLSAAGGSCECGQTMTHHIKAEGLDQDWRKWFDNGEPK